MQPRPGKCAAASALFLSSHARPFNAHNGVGRRGGEWVWPQARPQTNWCGEVKLTFTTELGKKKKLFLVLQMALLSACVCWGFNLGYGLIAHPSMLSFFFFFFCTLQDNPLQLPLKKCAVVGNSGILQHSGCGKDIDQADFIMRWEKKIVCACPWRFNYHVRGGGRWSQPGVDCEAVSFGSWADGDEGRRWNWMRPSGVEK